MRWIGCVLLLAGGVWGGAVWCGQRRRQAALGRDLVRQMAALRREVCVGRRPMGEIALALAAEAGESAPFWQVLEAALAGEESFPHCWQRALEILPELYREALTPLGTALVLGGAEAEALLRQAGEELHRQLCQERESRREQEKLAMVLAVSAAAMTALVLL